MLKKIYQELVAIRKELQAIRGSMEPNRTDSAIRYGIELTQDEKEKLDKLGKPYIPSAPCISDYINTRYTPVEPVSKS